MASKAAIIAKATNCQVLICAAIAHEYFPEDPSLTLPDIDDVSEPLLRHFHIYIAALHVPEENKDRPPSSATSAVYCWDLALPIPLVS